MQLNEQKLSWIKCQGDVWCNLATVNLSHAHFNDMNGVYVIWHGGTTPATVYVGQGYIRDRLAAHRSDARIQQYVGLGLFVTWASVPQTFREGVEKFLADTLHPLVGEAHPNVISVQATLPW
jgi:hypothetical protein